MGIIADTHVFGSRKGYECLSKSPGVTAAEDAALSEFGFGQSSDERYLAGLASGATAFGRPLPTGRMAITRVVRGPADDGGRPTLERRTLVVSASDYRSIRHGLSRIVNDQSLWSSASFAAGRTIAVPGGPGSSSPPGLRDWQIFDAWVLGADQGRATVVGDDDRSAEEVMALAGRLSEEDAIAYRWGVRMLSPIAWVDVITMSRFGTIDGRRPVHGVSGGDCVHAQVQSAYRAQPGRLPPLSALQAAAIRDEPLGLKAMAEEMPAGGDAPEYGSDSAPKRKVTRAAYWSVGVAASLAVLVTLAFLFWRPLKDTATVPAQVDENLASQQDAGSVAPSPLPAANAAPAPDGSARTESGPAQGNLTSKSTDVVSQDKAGENKSSDPPSEGAGVVLHNESDSTSDPKVNSIDLSDFPGKNGSREKSEDKESAKPAADPLAVLSDDERKDVERTLQWFLQAQLFASNLSSLFGVSDALRSEVFPPGPKKHFIAVLKEAIGEIRNEQKGPQKKQLGQGAANVTDLTERVAKFLTVAGPQPAAVHGHRALLADEERLEESAKSLEQLCPARDMKLGDSAKEWSDSLLLSDRSSNRWQSPRLVTAVKMCVLLRIIEIFDKERNFPACYAAFLQNWHDYGDNQRKDAEVPDSKLTLSRTDIPWEEIFRAQQVMRQWFVGAEAFKRKREDQDSPGLEPRWMTVANTLQRQGFHLAQVSTSNKEKGRKVTWLGETTRGEAEEYFQRGHWKLIGVESEAGSKPMSPLEIFNALTDGMKGDADFNRLMDQVRAALRPPVEDGGK